MKATQAEHETGERKRRRKERRGVEEREAHLLRKSQVIWAEEGCEPALSQGSGLSLGTPAVASLILQSVFLSNRFSSN